MKRLLLITTALILLVSCGGGGSRSAAKAGAASDSSASGTASSGVSAHKLIVPQPPAMLSGDSAKLDFVASRYWDNFDFTDTTWIADTTAFEATFYGWTEVLQRLPQERAAELTGGLIGRIAADTTAPEEMLLRFADVSEYYFQHPNSPFRNEELFIPVLRAVLAAPRLDDIYKIRPRTQLESALKNRPGMKAAEVAYTTERPGAGAASARKGRLSQMKADYVLLLFYNPGCHDCGRVEEFIGLSEVFAPLIASGRMKVLAVYVDEVLKAWREHLSQMPQSWTVGYNTTIRSDQSYDLPAIPNLYLLDAQKRVLFKDAPVERIEDYLNRRPAPNQINER